MSISSSLSNAISGMNAASRMAEIVSSNVANSLTDGYGRRSVNLSSGLGGVQVGSVDRFVDRGVLADRRLAGASLGGYEMLASAMNNIQSAIGQPGQSDSVSGRIVALEAALVDASSDPSSTIRLETLGSRLGDLAESINASSRAIQDDRVKADTSIADQIDLLNTSLSQVEKLNKDILSARNSGSDPSSLMDQRQRVVDTIAEIVPVRELDRDGGQIALMTPSGQSLIDGKAKQFGFTSNAVIASEMTIESGGLYGITLDGVSLGPNGVGKLAGGTLGAAFQVRDVELVAAQEGLDNVAADLIARFQDPTVDSTLAVGEAGLLTDNGTAFDVLNTTGLAERISVNAAVDPSAGGNVIKFRDGINAVTAGPSGNASLLQSLSAALSDTRSTATDLANQSAAGRAGNLEGDMGNRRLVFETELSFANARWSGLKEAEAAGGVDTDFEMQTLLRVEQAYAANARVVQTVQTLMQRLMEI